MPIQLLLLSSSRGPDGGYLTFALEELRTFLAAVESAIFVPYAAITVSHDEYAATTRARFAEIDVRLDSIHTEKNPRAALERAPAIVVGGGNTFQLLATLHEKNLLDVMRERVQAGALYVGASAGANLACPTIATTNDMPVVWPPAPTALGLVPFQINPHFVDDSRPGFHGETRRQRLAEFMRVSPNVSVVAMPEGSMLEVRDAVVRVVGDEDVRVFRGGEERSVRAGASMRVKAGAGLVDEYAPGVTRAAGATS